MTQCKQCEQLKCQIKVLSGFLKLDNSTLKQITNIASICDTMANNPISQKLLEEVHKLLKIYLTVPATSATSEKTHSVLKRIKNYLRSTMTQKRMNNVLICHALKERTDSLDLRDIAKTFINGGDTKRMNYFGSFKKHGYSTLVV